MDTAKTQLSQHQVFDGIDPQPIVAHLHLFLYAIVGGSLSFLGFLGVANRVDFHPDEAIYLTKIPVNLLNDSGLFYNAWYWITTLGSPTPIRARVSCAMLSAVGTAALVFAFGLWFPKNRKWLFWGIPLLLLSSYQGVFLVLRVRPELSWIILSCVAVASLAAIKNPPQGIFRFIAVVALMLLPMNHRLSWLACVCIGGYLILFGWKTLGPFFTVVALTSIPLGVLLNFSIRPMLLNESYDKAFLEFKTLAEGSPRLPPFQFLQNVFIECSTAFADTAANPSWWETILPLRLRGVVNHHAIANWLWAIGSIQPFFGRTWTQRYVLFTPSVMLFLMYLAGYFNPTYFSMFSLFSLLGFLFLAMQADQRIFARVIFGLLIACSIINGSSFLSTRILNHGRASFFDVERDLRRFIKDLPPDTTIAVSERFQSVGRFGPVKQYVIYKDQIPEDIQYMIIDKYDYEMYAPFIPDYAKTQNQIENAIENFNMLTTRIVPVYWKDKLRSATPNPKYSLAQGSWFFRNGVQYEIVILQSKSSEHNSHSIPAILLAK